MKVFLRLIIVMLITSACNSNLNVTKRKYRKGYTISSFKQNSKLNIENKQLTKVLFAKLSIERNINEFDCTKENNNFQADLVNGITLSDLNKKSLIGNSKKNCLEKTLPDSCGDVITLTSGVTIKCKVDEINGLIVKYKNCENLNGPSYSIKKVNISSIVYENGTKEDLQKHYNDTAKKNPTPTPTPVPASFNGNYDTLDYKQSKLARNFAIAAIVSFFTVIGIPLVLVFCPLAFYFGAKVLKRIGYSNKNPKIKRRAEFGLSIGLAFFIGWAIFFLIVSLFYKAFLVAALLTLGLGFLIYARA